MENITFSSPSSVTYIGEYAFLGCGSLKSIDIPSSVTRILDGAFEECADLKSVSISSRTEVRGDAFPENVRINYRD
jgi:hypothetical protein